VVLFLPAMKLENAPTFASWFKADNMLFTLQHYLQLRANVNHLATELYTDAGYHHLTQMSKTTIS
jgi:hypothetical protein